MKNMEGIYYSLMATFFFALYPIINKVLVETVPPIELAALYTAISTLLIFCILVVKGQLNEIRTLTKKNFFWLFNMALTGSVLSQIFFLTGINNSSATNAVLLTRFEALTMAAIGVIILKEKISKIQMLGAAIMVYGTFLIATKNFAETLTLHGGDTYIILAAICWGTSHSIVKIHLTKLNPSILIAFRNIFSHIMLMIILGGVITHTPTNAEFSMMAALVIFVMIIGQYLWYFGLERTSQINVALAFMMIPIIGVVYSVTLLNEQLMDYQIWGGLLTIVGMGLVEIKRIAGLKHFGRIYH